MTLFVLPSYSFYTFTPFNGKDRKQHFVSKTLIKNTSRLESLWRGRHLPFTSHRTHPQGGGEKADVPASSGSRFQTQSGRLVWVSSDVGHVCLSLRGKHTNKSSYNDAVVLIPHCESPNTDPLKNKKREKKITITRTCLCCSLGEISCTDKIRQSRSTPTLLQWAAVDS